MAFPETAWIWRNGEWIPWEDATIHVMSHVVHYGSCVFEGIRCYSTKDGPAIFRLPEHIRRLQDSARIYRMDIPDQATMEEACREVVWRNEKEACYIRPIAFRGYGNPGVNPAPSPVEVYVICWEWGAYLGKEGLANGVDACVSTWFRPAPNTYPAIAKAGGNYLNGQLLKLEAHANGYAEAIAMGPGGLISEGSGQNVFVVRDGVLLAPAIDGTFLLGITRDSLMQVARDLGIPVKEQAIPRELLYTADEVFFCGTAAEVTPVRSVDRIPVGDGKPGPVTKALQERFFAIVGGEHPDTHGWLTPVKATVGVA
ncbi:MAG TPA: branched-chain amino acid transaminase [Longimicrobiales bacterium]